MLDTAHLFLAEPEYLTTLERLFDAYPSQIDIVHLSDATPVRDGLAFESGQVDLDSTASLLKRVFDGTVILEVMPDEQAAALAQFREY